MAVTIATDPMITSAPMLPSKPLVHKSLSSLSTPAPLGACNLNLIADIALSASPGISHSNSPTLLSSLSNNLDDPPSGSLSHPLTPDSASSHFTSYICDSNSTPVSTPTGSVNTQASFSSGQARLSTAIANAYKNTPVLYSTKKQSIEDRFAEYTE